MLRPTIRGRLDPVTDHPMAEGPRSNGWSSRPATPSAAGDIIPRTNSSNSSHGPSHAAHLLSASPPPVASKRFAPDASIVLVGIRGSGKSTLGIIACAAMQRVMVDLEKAFQQTVGSTSAEFRRVAGASKCHAKQVEVLNSVLASHANHAVIVCSWLERGIQAILRDLCATNPVILISRDADAIQEHLKIPDRAKMTSLLNASGAIFHTCTNFHFFNITEYPTRFSTPESDEETARSDPIARKSPAHYLTLKRAERHFLKEFTYAVSIPLSVLLRDGIDVEEIETAADAIEIVVDNLWLPSPDGRITPPEASPSPLFPPAAPGGGLGFERVRDIACILGNIRRNTVLPVIFHVLAPQQSSQPPPPADWQHLYLDVVDHGLRMAAEFVTLDLRLGDPDLARFVSGKRQSKIIANFESTVGEDSWESPIWVSRYQRAKSIGCDLVRFVRPAASMEDNLAVSRLRFAVKKLGDIPVPLVAYNSGALGRYSACFNPVLTPVAPRNPPPSTEATNRNTGAASAYSPPLITSREATNALYSSFVYDPMKLYVFGANVDYSLSPPCTTPRSRPHPLIRDPTFAGASVGLPFKVSIIRLTDSLSPHAKAIGAVNTLIPIRRLNSDGSVPELSAMLRDSNRTGPGLSPANAVRPTATAVVVGAGGMARAAVYALLQLGVKNIIIYNRTKRTAQDMVAHFTKLANEIGLPSLGSVPNGDRAVRFHVLDEKHSPWPETFTLPTMIISCIPTHGMGHVPSPEFTVPQNWFASPTGGVVVELGYKTMSTPLLEQSRAQADKGWVTLFGLDLLPEQGFAQFELFTGRRSPRRLMRRAALRAYPDMEGKPPSYELQSRLRSIPFQEP
ncbi:unnamed protein product [Parascedosporium putredinis]|uniref:Quinate repressor protein n=1 Tax=Parascedosporium putredinis TaxID=1442378 RepID=A0A9P1M8B6_9PEZI|nr:unnamed protein product [Parascedosporium putredinis]CAI7989598.1 unnamed protein product [Parascedosporium putredinis]